ncbi:hypothetical protein [Plantactinospora sp. BC1]|uniref:hypothetical protein n=1 Tax=Plantactinospora sp. BC1 TaxID=2108470 RepID=UPI00131ED578|nr:hypothetical protein [Plantactinospora sp. BC1]
MQTARKVTGGMIGHPLINLELQAEPAVERHGSIHVRHDHVDRVHRRFHYLTPCHRAPLGQAAIIVTW